MDTGIKGEEVSELIENRYRNPDVVTIDWTQDDDIKALLLGRKVEKIAKDHMRLDDGTVVKIVPNEGGCACSAGDYELTDLNEVDNVITHVEQEIEEHDRWGGKMTYRVFVLAEDKKINLFAVDGDDGNGYHGTGYELLVRRP